jgi:hypothetical protein
MIESLVRIESNQKKWVRVFYEVSRAYADIHSLSPIAAICYDDEAKPNRKLGPDVINFLVDVERATRKALENDGNLLKQWKTLVFEETQVPNGATIANRCGRLYEIRRLRPIDYFRRIKKNAPGIRRVPLPPKVAA